MTVKTFAEAREAAEQAQQDAYRVLIYAVTPEGRSALLPHSKDAFLWKHPPASGPRERIADVGRHL
jgi:hypothetical protein